MNIHSISYFRVGNAQDYFFSEDFYYIDDKRDQETIIVNEFNYIFKNNRLIVNKYNIKQNEEISIENEDKYFSNSINEFILRNYIGENNEPFKNTMSYSDNHNKIINFKSKCLMKKNKKKNINIKKKNKKK